MEDNRSKTRQDLSTKTGITMAMMTLTTRETDEGAIAEEVEEGETDHIRQHQIKKRQRCRPGRSNRRVNRKQQLRLTKEKPR